MAGSWDHMVDDAGQFTGTTALENLGDCYEALEQCYGMVWYLVSRMTDDDRLGSFALIEAARAHSRDGIARSPGLAERRYFGQEG